MFDIDKIRSDFPILSRSVNGRGLIYLDNGATAQKPRVVVDKMDELYLEWNSNIHRGVHFSTSAQITRMYEDGRESVRRFINASSAQEVIFTCGATAAINTIAYCFAEAVISEGDNVVVSRMEHHSNIVPWQMACERKGAELRILEIDSDGELLVDMLPELIDGRTRIIAVTQASNVLGSCPDLKAVIDIAHRSGVPVLVDGCQGIVHGGVDVQSLDCDFYVFSGHKLYGPTGIGVLYGKREWLDRLPPFMGGGDMVDRVSFQKTTYAPLPLKFEAGTANFVGAIGLAKAIEYLENIDIKAAKEHERVLTIKATEGLQQIQGVHIYGHSSNKCSIVSFNIDGVHPLDIGMILDKLGIAVRTGTHCAQPLMEFYGVDGMCRASFALYNTLDEVDAFVSGVQRAAKMLKH